MRMRSGRSGAGGGLEALVVLGAMQRVVVLFVGQYVVFWGGWVPPRLGPLGMGMWVGARGKRRMRNPSALGNEPNIPISKDDEKG